MSRLCNFSDNNDVHVLPPLQPCRYEKGDEETLQNKQQFPLEFSSDKPDDVYRIT